MALVRLDLTAEQARWLLKKLGKELEDAHWARTPPDSEDIRFCTDVNRELQAAAKSAGVRVDRGRVGQCDS